MIGRVIKEIKVRVLRLRLKRGSSYYMTNKELDVIQDYLRLHLISLNVECE